MLVAKPKQSSGNVKSGTVVQVLGEEAYDIISKEESDDFMKKMV